ncbi:alpha/beta fold hydrolase [Syntrophorhabdus aromaticivorans]|jgi:pimeloyl-ACP methyl ester carboxylesterase|uniref:Alpha/beta hydrolase n=1 Tax=Syntrophorhabdus aromaticivorans TaxID=328301 RepID=A0A971S025_9BACT|nr:alpha/beta hydrolase [Syntrophorhabdus aromaticivorans]NLW34159.1 alpha/beta hydrolase [Syntrophorhabdus aromaticivorans]
MDVYTERHGSGEPILFVHGAGGSSEYWYYQKEHLKRHMEVLTIDLPGHGRSVGDGCRSIEEFREAVREALQKLGIKKCYMAGHSMGGAIAMSFALAYPDILKGIVLICTGARLRALPAILDGLMKDKEATVRMIIDYAFSRKIPEKLKEKGFMDMMRCNAETIYNDFVACDRFDAMNLLKSIQTPSLIICGEDDLLTPPKYSEYLHKIIRNSQLNLIRDAGHMAPLEKPEEINNMILPFVAEIEKARNGL